MSNNYILSINPCTHGLNYHDPASAIILDGKIIFAIEEERINGIKGSKGIFPLNAVRECMNYCKITEDDLECIAVGYDIDLWNNRFCLETKSIVNQFSHLSDKNYKIFDKMLESNLFDRFDFFNNKEKVDRYILNQCGFKKNIEVKYFSHHLSHIASSYEHSGFDEAVGIVVDGIGETATTSIWKINNHKYEKIEEYNYPNSLGYFYSIATEFLGFTPWCHEGKTMALAPYGKADKKIEESLNRIISFENNICNVGDFISENEKSFLMIDNQKALNSLQNLLGFKQRTKESPLDANYANFAYHVQKILETSVTALINHAMHITGYNNVCVAGGIFMNCKMNMVLRENPSIKKFFVQPLAGDLGLVLGSGALASSKKNDKRIKSLYFGPSYSDAQILRELKINNLNYKKSTNISKDVAKILTEGRIVCWFQGRMEMGARALGNRSIIADPRKKDTANRVNSQIKHRELWRPFACSVLQEHCSQIFEKYNDNNIYPFMIEAFKVKPDWIERIPAVIHEADFTSRPQTVCHDINPTYYELISYFYELTGCPLVLNTSFNDKGQPIVMNPHSAIDFFLKNNVDCLAIGNYLVLKEEQ